MSNRTDISNNLELSSVKDHGPSSYKDDKMPGTNPVRNEEDQTVEDR
tara:strand:- start:2771 stop:2911 length:141 start_codon:yes stop_codon:yes gene_type:complete